MAQISLMDTEARFRGMGGDYMQASGLSLAAHYSEVAVMGFVEVVFGFRKVLKYLSLIQKDILDNQPDVLILVDYGGFNLKMAAFAKKHDILVHYYIPPKVWAWNQTRALKIKILTDRVYCILPFEPDFFAKFGVSAHYVGNPLLDEIVKFIPDPFFHQKNGLEHGPVVALLPGSRKQELQYMMRAMLDVVRKFPQAQFIIAGVSNLPKELYGPARDAGIKVVFDQTYDLLHHASAAVVTSGTATLETALFRIPQVVVYRTSPVSYAIAKRLIQVPFISLVNLIAGQKVVTELIQQDYNVEKLSQELNLILASSVHKGQILHGYDLIREKIGSQSASETTARLIWEALRKK